MDTTLFLIVLVFSILMLVGLIYLVMSPSTYKGIQEEHNDDTTPVIQENENENINNNRGGGGLSRMNVRNRNRNQNNNNNTNTTTTTTTTSSNNNISDSDSDSNSDDEISTGTSIAGGFKSKKMGTKKLEKLKRKQEKKKYNESLIYQREEAKKKQEEDQEQERLKKQERLEREKEIKEQEDKERLEQEKKETEEYNLLKGEISLEDSGDASNNEEKEKSLLEKFINHLKERKMVLLEDVAMEFNLKTLDVVERIKSLDKQGLISGVIDDRGKFIYISKEELASVVKFINKKGRIDIETLAFESNKLIDLSSKVIINDENDDNNSNINDTQK